MRLVDVKSAHQQLERDRKGDVVMAVAKRIILSSASTMGGGGLCSSVTTYKAASCHEASMEEDSVPMADIRNCCKRDRALGILDPAKILDAYLE
jgi:hypothetical protein